MRPLQGARITRLYLDPGNGLSSIILLSFVLETAPATDRISGSSSLVLTPGGSLQARGSLSGSSLLVLTPGGSLQARGSLSGSSLLVLTPGGSLQGRGYLSGSSSLVVLCYQYQEGELINQPSLILIVYNGDSRIQEEELINQPSLILTVINKDSRIQEEITEISGVLEVKNINSPI